MDLETLFKNRQYEKDRTKAHYTNIYGKAQELFGDGAPFARSEKLINKTIDESDQKTYLSYHILILAVMMRSDDERPVVELIANMNRYKKKLEEERQEKLDDLKLPDYETYFKNNDLLAESMPQKYIVNKLFQLYGFRNAEMMIRLVRLKRGEREKKEKENTLTIKQRKVNLRIAEYKTLSSYGIKDISFSKKEQPLLYKTLLNYYNDGNHFLLTKKDKTQISKKSLHSHIRKLTNGLGSGTLFKMSVAHFRLIGDLNRIAELGKTRGTALGTINDNYNAQNSTETDDHPVPLSPPIET